MNTTHPRLIADALVLTHYERLPGLWKFYDIYQHKAPSMGDKSWGISSRWVWRTRETCVLTATTEAHTQPVTCPRLRYAQYLRTHQKQPEVALLYPHAQAWHACIYEQGLLTRYVRQDDPEQSTAGLFTAWDLLVQQYPKAGVLTILCTQLPIVQMMRTHCHNPVTIFSFS